MDAVFNADKLPFCSDVIMVRTFLDDAYKAAQRNRNSEPIIKPELGKHETETEHEKKAEDVQRFQTFIDTSFECAGVITDLLSPDNLKPDDEQYEADDLDPFIFPMPNNTELSTLRHQHDEVNLRAANSAYRQAAIRAMKYNQVNFKVLNENTMTSSNNRNVSTRDVVLSVLLLKPYNRPLDRHEIRLGRLLKADAQFLVRGRQNLFSLAERIQCPSRYALEKDYSENNTVDPNDFSKDRYPANFFFIDDTFYVDEQYRDSFEITRTITEWAKTRPDEIKSLKVAGMAETNFVDLKLRLGFPYLYFHQGSCEHLIVFTDLQLLNDATDNQDVDAYPLPILHKSTKRGVCCACKTYTAKWVTYANERLPMHPGFFCDECFKKFNYDSRGKKIGNFEAVPYFDRTALN